MTAAAAKPIPLEDDNVTTKPGDFPRRGDNGPPMVTDPSGAAVKGGRNRGLPKMVTYGRASAAGAQIENTYNLEKWAQRRIVYGLAIQPQDLSQLTTLEVDGDAYKEAADKVVVRAKDAAKASLAADRGTLVHSLTENDDGGATWLTKAEQGEDLGVGVEVQAELVAGWRRLLDEYGFEVLANEAKVVHDGWRLAGTLDRVVRCTRDTVVSGITINAGTVLVLDIKTGKLTVDKNGVISWWHKYAPQVAAYAGAVPYDVETGERGTWPWPIDQDVALIAHLPVLELIEKGEATISLVVVDLEAGRHAGDLCRDAKDWGARVDVFAAPHPAVPLKITPPATVAPVETGDPFAGLPGQDGRRPLVTVERVATPQEVDAGCELGVTYAQVPPESRAGLTARADRLKAHHPDVLPWLQARWPQGVPPLKRAMPSDFHAIDQLLTAAEAHFAVPFDDVDMTRPTPTPAPVETPARAPWVRPDDGPAVTAGDVDALKKSVAALPRDVQALIGDWLNQATRWGRALGAGATNTVRSFEVKRAMINAALCFIDKWRHDDEYLRTILAAVLDDETVIAAELPAGAVFAALTVDQARAAADLFDRAYEGEHVVAVGTDGRLVPA